MVVRTNAQIFLLPGISKYKVTKIELYETAHSSAGRAALVKFKSYFFAPKDRFFNLSWLPRHFLQRSAEIGFLPPHLKHTLKNNLRCWAICFLLASVIGISSPVSIVNYFYFCLYPIGILRFLSLITVFHEPILCW
jgi:hypothetical protein